MAIVKSRPRVRVLVPNEIRPGDEFRATVLLDCRRKVDVESVGVVLEGYERWTLGSGDRAVSRRLSLVRLAARISEARELPKGRTELVVRIPLPASAPPTYRGAAARIEYEFTVEVAIPWWPDRVASFDIFVAPPLRESPETVPKVYSSDPAGPRRREAHAEVSLTSGWTRVGDLVEGALALSNVAHNRYSHVLVGLRGLETLYDAGRRRAEREYTRYQIRLGAEEAREGEMIPFRFRLPDDVMAELPWTRRPDGSPGLCSLAWEFEMIVGIRWGTDLTLRVPFAVLPKSARRGDAPRRLAPPTVGSDRLRAVWESVGHEHGLRYEAQSLYGSFGETSLSVRRDHMGRSGIFVVAHLAYPELHLDLEVEPASAITKIVGGGARVGDPGWDRDHYVRARDEEQVADVLRAIVPAMKNAVLRRMDDRGLVLAVRDSGQSATRMRRFIAASVHLARTFEAVRRDLPPPPAVRAALPVWQDLATRMHGGLETARMRIAGQLGMLSAEVRLAFDDAGQPSSTWLTVVSPSPIEDGYRLRVTGAMEDAAAKLEERFEGELRELVKVIAHGAHEFAIEEDRVAIGWPLILGVAHAGSGEAPIAVAGGSEKAPTAASTEQRLSRMARLITMLRGQTGPYR